MTLNQNRVYEIEILHALAFAGVVVQHSLGAYARRGASLVGTYELSMIAAIFELVRFAVPMFLFLSAFLLCVKPSSLSYGMYLKKRSRRILLPYAVWTAGYFAYTVFRTGEAPSARTGLAKILNDLGNGTASYHLWYVVMLFQFVLFAPLVLKGIRTLKERQISGRNLAVIFGGSLLVGVLLLQVLPLIGSETGAGAFLQAWRTRLCLSYLVFFVLGAFAGAYYDRFCTLLLRYRGWILGVSVLFFFYSVSCSVQVVLRTGAISFGRISFLNPRYVLLTATSLLAWYLVALWLRDRKVLPSLFRFADRGSYQAYLCHAMLLDYLSFRLIEMPVTWNLPVFYGILTTLTVFGSLAIAFLIEVAGVQVRRLAVILRLC